MKPSFWIKRFFMVGAGVFVVLLVVGLLRSRPIERVARESARWSRITAADFVAARMYQARRGQHCALCGDTPAMARNPHSAKSIAPEK